MSQLPLRKRLLSLIAEEIETYLPQFEPYTSDYQMILYACRDLEQWVEYKWAVTGHNRVYETIEQALQHEPKVFKVFLNFWVGRWLEKWRERVKVLSTKPKLPTSALNRIKKARIMYRQIEHRKELKQIVTRKLLSQGEICLTEVIADTLIIDEIARRVRSTDEDSEHVSELFFITPMDILNSVSFRISRLHEEKGPLVYLNIKPHTL